MERGLWQLALVLVPLLRRPQKPTRCGVALFRPFEARTVGVLIGGLDSEIIVVNQGIILGKCVGSYAEPISTCIFAGK